MARAQAADAGLTSTTETRLAVAEICLRLDGLPLAIELAAARVTNAYPDRATATPDEAAAVLSAGPRDLPARQQTLRNTIDWSHELLGVPEQQLFHQLSVFAGGFTAEAAEAISRRPQGIDVLDTLGMLLDQSLVQRKDVAGRTRFSMLETLREFASEKLAEGPDASGVHANATARFYRDAGRGGRSPHTRSPTGGMAGTARARARQYARRTRPGRSRNGGDVELGSQLVGTPLVVLGCSGPFLGRSRMGEASHASRRRAFGSIPRRAAESPGEFRIRARRLCARAHIGREAAGAYEQLGLPVDAAWLQGLEAIAVQYQGDLDAGSRFCSKTPCASRAP